MTNMTEVESYPTGDGSLTDIAFSQVKPIYTRRHKLLFRTGFIRSYMGLGKQPFCFGGLQFQYLQHAPRASTMARTNSVQAKATHGEWRAIVKGACIHCNKFIRFRFNVARRNFALMGAVSATSLVTDINMKERIERQVPFFFRDPEFWKDKPLKQCWKMLHLRWKEPIWEEDHGAPGDTRYPQRSDGSKPEYESYFKRKTDGRMYKLYRVKDGVGGEKYDVDIEDWSPFDGWPRNVDPSKHMRGNYAQRRNDYRKKVTERYLLQGKEPPVFKVIAAEMGKDLENMPMLAMYKRDFEARQKWLREQQEIQAMMQAASESPPAVMLDPKDTPATPATDSNV